MGHPIAFDQPQQFGGAFDDTQFIKLDNMISDVENLLKHASGLIPRNPAIINKSGFLGVGAVLGQLHRGHPLPATSQLCLTAIQRGMPLGTVMTHPVACRLGMRGMYQVMDMLVTTTIQERGSKHTQ